jgi:hypothetical protein
VLFVRDPQRNRTCRFDWFTTDGTGRAQGSLADPGKGKRWVDVLAGLFQEQLAAQSVHALKQPSVRLQLRGGAGGGNPRHIDLAGETNGRVDERSQQPIDVVTPATINEPCVGWSDGGSIPIGSTFAITRIDYSGGNRGDGNGPGGFRVVVNDKAIVDIEPSDPAIRGTWTRRLVVPNGAEGRTYFEILNSSWGEVQITGEFVAGAGLPGFGGRNAGFGRAPARAAPPAPVLGVPEVHLQMRSGAVGNPCTIDMRVRRTLRINRIAKSPLDFTTPLAANEWCVAFGKGGLLPPGCTFVVTKVRYHGETGDGGGSPLRIVIAGQRIVEIATAKQAITDEWNGSLEIPAGEETRTYVEVGNGSYVDVVITGRFEFR